MYKVTKSGVEKRIETWKIIIPLFGNQNQKFPQDIVDSIQSKIIDEFGGLTSINVLGQWKSGGELFFDKNILIIVDIAAKEHEKASSFFVDLKHNLMKSLNQQKIHVTKEGENYEVLTFNELLQELGFETPSDQPLELKQENIERLIDQSEIVKKRLSYKTLRFYRDVKSKKILWEREILGIKIKTQIEDVYDKNVVILPSDKIEDYFTEELFGKTLIIIGDYEFQKYILDQEKRKYIIGSPSEFSKYDQIDKGFLYGPHPWHGQLKTSEFIPTFVEEILINYIILREFRISRDHIKITVGSDGSMQTVEKTVLLCPAYIPNSEVQKAILDNLINAYQLYENGTIDEIALMQAKVLNRYNLKKAMIKSSLKGTLKTI